MKRLNNFTRRSGLALLAGLVLTMAFGAQTARAQALIMPFVDCVEREFDQSGAATGNDIAYFGYFSTSPNVITLPVNPPFN